MHKLLLNVLWDELYNVKEVRVLWKGQGLWDTLISSPYGAAVKRKTGKRRPSTPTMYCEDF